jgi:hypothetical protein
MKVEARLDLVEATVHVRLQSLASQTVGTEVVDVLTNA